MTFNKTELKALKDTYFVAKALYESVRDTAEEIQKNILKKYPFYEDAEKLNILNESRRMKEKTRILKPFDSYLMSDADFDTYLNLCYDEYKRAGIDDKRGRGWVPEAESRELYIEATKMLVEFGLSIIPDKLTKEKETLKEAVKNIKYRDKILDLVLRLEC